MIKDVFSKGDFPKYLIQFRKILHSVPELSGNEKQTAFRLVEFIKKCHPDELITEVGGLGIIATWNSFKKGPEIIFRADMDALPIHELSDITHKSVIDGISHQCGHDGHMAILCGLAMMLNDIKPLTGKVHLLFQPAEETGLGALKMLNDSKFKDIKPDFVFALHNIPGMPLHSVIVREETFTASVTSIIIDLCGQSAHAAEPDLGINPASAVAQIINAMSALEHNSNDDKMQLLTPIFIQLGEKSYGTAASEATLHYTLRSRTEDGLRELKTNVEQQVSAIAHSNNLKVSFDYIQSYMATQNHPEAVGFIRQAAKQLNLQVIEMDQPFRWGEDFGVFTHNFKGCLFGLGAGTDCPPLHSGWYDFPDALIETGVNIFARVLELISGFKK